jgi:3',5'-cyclic AMP phosphodiesterase CpdA
MPYDGFVVTGDLATTGDQQDLSIARSFFEGSLCYSIRHQSEQFSLFKFPADKLAVLPGNHDRYDGLLCHPGGTNFEDTDAFCEQWRLTPTTSLGNSKEKVQSFHFSKNDDSLTVIAADFSLPQGKYRNPLRYLGKGLVNAEILKALVNRTEMAKQTSAVVWAVQFPPRFRGLSRSLRLEDEDRLIDSATRLGVSHILAGHTHICDRYFARSRNSNYITVICAGSPTARGTESPSFFDLEIAVNNLTVEDIKPHIFVLREFSKKSGTKEQKVWSFTR